MPAKLSQKSLSSQQAVDTRMLKAFEQNYDEIKQYVVVESKRREHILSVAIELHEQQNYIACIPLFLAQADGIFEEYLGLSAFTRHDGKLKRIASDLNSTFSNDSVAKAYFGQFKASSQFSGNSGNADNSDKAKGPNRNGILHGDSRHLDYGSYINSCKSICFLSSVMWLAEKYREKQT